MVDIPRTLFPTVVLQESFFFFSLLGVTLSLTSRYHPQSNGQTERKVKEISRFLGTLWHSHQDSWNQYLAWAEYAQNSLRPPSTDLTPFQCTLSFQPPLFPWSCKLLRGTIHQPLLLGEREGVEWGLSPSSAGSAHTKDLCRYLEKEHFSTPTWTTRVGIHEGHPSAPTLP